MAFAALVFFFKHLFTVLRYYCYQHFFILLLLYDFTVLSGCSSSTIVCLILDLEYVNWFTD